MNQDSETLWCRASNVVSCANAREVSAGEDELVLEVAALRSEERKVSNAERMLKVDLIDAYTARKQRIQKLEKVLALADELKETNKKLRTDIREIILADNEKFVLSAKQIIRARRKK